MAHSTRTPRGTQVVCLSLALLLVLGLRSQQAQGAGFYNLFSFWKNPSTTLVFDYDFTALASLPATLTLTSGSATYYNSSGTLVTAASGSPRFDYAPVSHLPMGLLLEPAATNLLTDSKGLNGTNWVSNLITIQTNT